MFFMFVNAFFFYHFAPLSTMNPMHRDYCLVYYTERGLPYPASANACR